MRFPSVASLSPSLGLFLHSPEPQPNTQVLRCICNSSQRQTVEPIEKQHKQRRQIYELTPWLCSGRAHRDQRSSLTRFASSCMQSWMAPSIFFLSLLEEAWTHPILKSLTHQKNTLEKQYVSDIFHVWVKSTDV